MDKKLIKKKIFAFFNKYKVGTLSTIDTKRNIPESAAIGFGHTENLEIIFGTFINSRKYANLQINSNVSFVVGWDSDTGSIQYEGVANQLSPKETKQYALFLISKNSESEKYFSLPDERFFLVKPRWIRFLDNDGNPPETYEITFSKE